MDHDQEREDPDRPMRDLDEGPLNPKRRPGLSAIISIVFACALIVLLVVAVATGNSGAGNGSSRQSGATANAAVATSTSQTASSQAATSSSPAATPVGDALSVESPSYAFAWFSDTQYYSSAQSPILSCMTSWIADNAARLNIAYAFLTGDVIDDFDDAAQWTYAYSALAPLASRVPLAIAAGNHDVDLDNLDYSKFDAYFGDAFITDRAIPGGSYEGGEARYDLLDEGDDHWLIVSIGFGTDEAGLDWVNSTLAAYPDRTAIIITHSYMKTDGELTDEGQTIFDDVVSRNSNVRLVLCGHKHGRYHTSVDLDDNGDGTPDRTVYEVLSDYQSEDQGGLGYIVLMVWNPTTSTMTFMSYSPYLDDTTLYDSTPEVENFSFSL